MFIFLENLDNYIQLGFGLLSIFFFYIVYTYDTFIIQDEENWDLLRQQYAQLYQKEEEDLKHFPNEMASFCYKAQEQISSIQWEYIYFICLSSLILTLYSVLLIIKQFFLLESGFLFFSVNIILGAVIMFYLCYFINNVYIGTVVKVPLRTDPLRWAYGNGFFLSLFCLGMIIIAILFVNYLSQYLFQKHVGIAFVLGGSLSLYFRREQQSIFGRSILIATDLSIKDNMASEVMDYITYAEKLASIMGHILSDTHLLDIIFVLLLYFTLPRVLLSINQIFPIGELNINVYSVVMLINYFVQFILSFFISEFQSNDVTKNVLKNVRTQIIVSSLFSIITLVILFFYNSTYMSIASFGLITSMLLIIYLEYVTNHSFPAVRSIASAALNAPMLNIMNANFLGDLGQLFVLALVGLFTFISREIGGKEGLYAFLTGLIMNALVMTSIQFSGNSIMIGLKFAQIAQVNCDSLEKINLATCNYALYLKTITIICLFIITLIFFPINEIHFFGIFLGILLVHLFKGIFLQLISKETLKCLRAFHNGTFFDLSVQNLWQLTGIITFVIFKNKLAICPFKWIKIWSRKFWIIFICLQLYVDASYNECKSNNNWEQFAKCQNSGRNPQGRKINILIAYAGRYTRGCNGRITFFAINWFFRFIDNIGIDNLNNSSLKMVPYQLQIIIIFFLFFHCITIMKSQPSKKITLKLKLDANTFVTKTKPSIPPSSKCSQKTASPTNTTECTVSSSKKYFRNEENKSTSSDDPTKSQLIQYLLQENKHLQKQNEDKEQLINFLSSGKPPKKRLVLNTERSTEIKSQKLPQINTKNQVENESTPFCFTFCQLETQSQKSVRVNKLPKEFQIVPNKKRYFI